MSGEMLSNEQVAALVEAARQGHVDGGAQAPRGRRPRRVREIDFTRPTKFTPDQQRRIERAHEGFCRAVATQLSAELRTPVELEVLNVAQLTWSSALDDIPQPSLYAIVEAQPLGTTVLVSVEMSSVRRLIMRLLGGADPGRASDRGLTEIDQMLARRILGTILNGFSATWHDLIGIELRLAGIE